MGGKKLICFSCVLYNAARYRKFPRRLKRHFLKMNDNERRKDKYNHLHFLGNQPLIRSSLFTLSPYNQNFFHLVTLTVSPTDSGILGSSVRKKDYRYRARQAAMLQIVTSTRWPAGNFESHRP